MIVCALFEPFALWHMGWLEPALRKKPLVVLEKGRVSHLSRMALQAGVERGMALEGARARCEALVVVEPDHAMMQQAWEELLSRLYTFTDRVEPAAWGRVFLALSEEDATHVAETFHARVGGGSSQEHARLLALMAREGEANLSATATELQRLDVIPVPVLGALGLADKMLLRLTWLGINTLGELRRWSRTQLELYLGDETKLLTRYLYGPHRTDVRRYVPPGVLRESHSFEEAVLEPWQLELVLKLLVQKLVARLGDRAATHLTLTAEVAGLSFSAGRVSKQPLRDEGALLRLVALAFADCGVQGLGVDRLELTLSGLHRPSVQERLWHHKEDVDKAVRVVEARFPGAMLKFEELDPFTPVPEFSHRLVSLGTKEVTHETLNVEVQDHLPHSVNGRGVSHLIDRYRLWPRWWEGYRPRDYYLLETEGKNARALPLRRELDPSSHLGLAYDPTPRSAQRSLLLLLWPGRLESCRLGRAGGDAGLYVCGADR